MRRKDQREQAAPARELRTQHDADRLRVNGANAADDGVELSNVLATARADCPEREDEVPSRDRNSIAPTRLGADAVRQREGPLLGVRDARHEGRLECEPAVDDERRLEDLLGDRIVAVLVEDVEACGFRARKRDHERPAGPRRRLGRSAVCPCDSEERDGDGRCER